MSEPFHLYAARRQFEREISIPTLDAPAVTIRLRRKQPRGRGLPLKLALGVSAVFAVLFERIS